MSDSTTNTSISHLSAKIDDLVLGLKWMISLFLVLISIPNFLVSLTIGHFAEIFRDALPGKPLPYLTVAVVSNPTFLHLLALVWPIISIVYIVYSNRIRNWTIGAAAIAFFIGLQLCLTQAALLMPMTDLMVGVSDPTAK